MSILASEREPETAFSALQGTQRSSQGSSEKFQIAESKLKKKKSKKTNKSNKK